MNEAAKDLRDNWLTPGDVVYTQVTHVSRSGMQRVIKLFVMIGNKPVDISYDVSKALGWKLSKDHEGVVVKGVGMDMGFHTVSTLAYVVFADDEEAQETDNRSKDVMQRSKCYWLEQRWL